MLTASPFKLKIASVLAGMLAVGFSGVVLGETINAPLFRRETQSCMGTKWHIALYAEDAESANTAFERAWVEIREIDAALSNYLGDSELNQFCKTAPHDDFIKVSEHLATVLRAAANVSQQTDGYFDVTIAPVANLWRRARAKHRLPDSNRLAQELEKVNWKFVEFGDAPKFMRITQPGVQIDLGGIAKGYAVDRALSALQSAGIRAALVNGGGDLRAFGTVPDADGWTVKIAGIAPDDATRELTLQNQALATSGDAWQYLEVDGKRYSHIIDPKTGIGATRRLSVSVLAPTCMQADALASALSVMPAEQGWALASKLDDVRVLLVEVADDGQVIVRKTPSFPSTRPVAPQ